MRNYIYKKAKSGQYPLPPIDRRFGILAHHLVFDTGIANNLFRISNEESADRFWSQLKELNYFRADHVLFATSSFVILEAIGFRTKQLSDFEKTNSLKEKCNDIFNTITVENMHESMMACYQLYISALEKFEPISRLELNKLYITQLDYRNSWCAEHYFKKGIGPKLLLENPIARLRASITIDAIQRFALEKCGSIQRGIISAFFLSFLFQQSEHEENISVSRYFGASLNNKTGETAEHLFRSSELVDTEISHLLVNGFQANRRKNRVCVFTSDSLDSWLLRIDRQIEVMRYISRLTSEEPNQLFINPGYIFQVCTTTGTIRPKYISVDDHFDLTGLQFQPIPGC